MIVIPFRAEHFASLDIQPAQAHVRDFVNAGELASIEDQNAFTCLHDGRALACFGYVEIYPHRAQIWGLLAASCGRHMTGVTRVARRFIASLPHRRIEMDVDTEFDAGHRWARMLGFQLEAPRLRRYGMNGGDTAIYARIRP